MIQTKEPVDILRRIQQDRKGRLGLLQPGLCPIGMAKGNGEHLGVQGRKFWVKWRQLRHMIATGQSSQMAQKDQQRMVALAPGVAERNRFAGQCVELIIRGGLSYFEFCHDSSLLHVDKDDWMSSAVYWRWCELRVSAPTRL
jgi:hypothetical protein